MMVPTDTRRETQVSKGTMLGIILVLTLVSLGWAQGTPRLSIVMDEAKVNLTRAEAAGNEEIQYAPGDTIRYELKAINVGDGTMTRPVVTDPVPGGVDYIPLSAMGAGTRTEFSIDDAYCCDPQFFEIFTVIITGGGNGARLNHPGSILLSESCAKKYSSKEVSK